MSQPSPEHMYADFYEFVENMLKHLLGREPTIEEIEEAIDQGDWEPNGDSEMEDGE